MLRHFGFSLVALVLVAGVALAADKAKVKTVNGAFASYKDGTLTLKVTGKKGDEPKAQDFKVADDTKVTVFDGKTKKEGTAKDAFKDVKEGTQVTVTVGEDDKVAAIQVGNAIKMKTVSGALGSYKDGTLTIKVTGKKGDEPKAQDFKVADDIKVTTLDGKTKKEGTAKDAFKDVKEGTPVAITIGVDDKVVSIQVGTASKVVKGKTVKGALASYKDGTLTIKVAGKKGDEPKAQDFKVADDIKVTVFDGKTKKEGTAKDSFKDVKEGTLVSVLIGADDKITGIQVGNADQAKGKTVSGALASFKAGTLTLLVKGKKGDEPKAQDFKIADEIKVTTFDADTKKEGTAKDAFKDVKEGTPVTIKIDENDKIAAIQVGNAPKKKP